MVHKKQTKLSFLSHKKLLLVKILFEEVRFTATFEGREKMAVTESERKRVTVSKHDA